jgi:hypothetical protein
MRSRRFIHWRFKTVLSGRFVANFFSWQQRRRGTESDSELRGAVMLGRWAR